MRAPSSHSDLYAWWKEALHNPDIARHDGLPECGLYKRRMVRGGPWVAARIWCERDIDPETLELTAPEVLRCEVAGEPADPLRHWLHLIPITCAEFARLEAARTHDMTMAATHAAVDLTKEPAIP